MSAMKKTCPWCGIANPEEANYCSGCGSELTPGTTPARTAAPAETPKAPTPVERAKQSASASRAPEVPRAKQRTAPSQIRPGYVYAGIAAVVILGYLYMKNEAPAPAVEQNTSLMQSDSSGQRIASMEKFLAANPTDAEARLAYANMLHDARQFPRAIAAYTKYLDATPKNPDARVDLAICYFESGNTETALAQLRKALEFSPRHQPAMFNLGIVYLNLEKAKESHDWFSRCVAVDPTTPIAARAKQLLSQHSLTNKNLQ